MIDHTVAMIANVDSTHGTQKVQPARRSRSRASIVSLLTGHGSSRCGKVVPEGNDEERADVGHGDPPIATTSVLTYRHDGTATVPVVQEGAARAERTWTHP
jgi:hypothetical protein